MAGNIVYLIGFPGVGKLTIAKEIVKQQPDFVLVDNHLISNPILRVLDGCNPLPNEIGGIMSQIRAIVLDTMVRFSPPHRSFVMTFVHEENEGEKAECHKIEAAARQRGGLYFPVLLTCDIEENRRRIVSPERGLNLKCINPCEPDRRHKGPPLLRFDDHPNRIQMDVTHIQPAEAARRILQHVSRLEARAAATAAVTDWPALNHN